MSPPGKDLWWFWTGLTPSIPRDGWDVARKQITDTIISDADQYYKGLEDLQVSVHPLVMPDIEERFWAIDGSVYHVDPTISRFGPNKPAIGFAGYKTPVDGLFLTGSGTHPVAGISGMPGQNAARVMLKHFRTEDGARSMNRLGVKRPGRSAPQAANSYSSGQNDPFPSP
jgi:phytoene dehydrogenase-like protein